MFVDLLAVAGYLSSNFTIPQAAVTGLSQIMDGGSCSAGDPSPAASLAFSWTVVNPDATLFDIKVYENDSLLTTLAGDATSYNRSLNPYVLGATGFEYRYLATYRFDVVRRSDGTVVSTVSGDPIDVFLGLC